MNNVLVVANYNAGCRQAVFYKKKLHKYLMKKCKKFKFVTIDEIEDINSDEFDTIIAAGGDGTVNKVVSKIVDDAKDLIIIPCGTANLLAAKLGMSMNLDKTLKIIDKHNIKKIDLLKINDLPCILRCGFGYDADIICKTPQILKNILGYFAYFLAGIFFALRLTPKQYEIEADEKDITVTATCIIVANAANMCKNLISIANESQLDDGMFDVFILKTKNIFSFLLELIKIIAGKHNSDCFAQYFRAKNLTIKNDWQLCHIDGEKIKLKNKISVKIQKQKINVYCK